MGYLHRLRRRRRRRHSTASISYEQANKHLPVSVVYSKSKWDDLESIEMENNDCYVIRNSGPGFKEPQITSVIEEEGEYSTIIDRVSARGEPQPTVTSYHDGEPVRANYAREIGSLNIPPAELKHSQTGVYEEVATNTYHGSQEKRGFVKMVFSRPIPVPEFGKYVAELHADSNQPFKDLYQVMLRGQKIY
jgi:hypothetical protein